MIFSVINLKISHLKQKILLTVIYFIVVLLFALFVQNCIFKRFFGIHCPGCGMTRACVSALRFDFASAFSYHPMFWSMPLLYLYFLVDGKLFPGKYTDKIILSGIGVGFVVNWIVGFFI